MNIVIKTEVRIKDIKVSKDTITAHLTDGRTISVPIAWSWRLAEATPEKRANYQIIADGHGVHWPDIDEDISAEGMLYGTPAPRPKLSKVKKQSGVRSCVLRLSCNTQDLTPFCRSLH